MSSAERELKVKSILITQPQPEAGKKHLRGFLEKVQIEN